MTERQQLWAMRIILTLQLIIVFVFYFGLIIRLTPFVVFGK